ncbi:cytochrome c oxidase subunit 5A, mitochondrial-like [Paralichthys olivaceus]|uniref:cytochrome c oxidase subunit 5A, mitochondrial-like n=1 Tax=Paralichthys olivaceus TaxID=8255 RepID=UPI0037525712
MGCVCACAVRGARTCQAKLAGVSFLLPNVTDSCSWQRRNMFRAAVRLSVSGVRSVTRARPGCQAPLASRCYSHGKQETDEEFDARWVTYFNKPDIDAWELRKGMNTLIGYDLVPEPKILEAALRACRRLDDLASAVRILEAVKHKAGPHKDIYPYLIQELQPTLSELGVSTPEDLGIDKL